MERTVRITEVLRNHNFLKLWIGQIVSALGDRFHQMALLGLIMKKGGKCRGRVIENHLLERSPVLFVQSLLRRAFRSVVTKEYTDRLGSGARSFGMCYPMDYP